jgi:Gpi18-like mannosyltransferase
MRRHSFPLQLFAFHRVSLLLIMYFSLTLFPQLPKSDWQDASPNAWTQGWSAWDGDWYRGIAEEGYTNEPKRRFYRDTAFFPLYPMLIAGVRPLVGGQVQLAGMLVSSVCFLLALLGLAELYKQLTDERTARKALILLCAFPFSFVFGAMYTESLFLAAVVWSFLSAHRGRWAWAGFLAALAGATRVVGILMVPTLLLLYLELVGFQWRRIRADVLGPLLGLFGPLAHLLYLAGAFADPLAFLKAQKAPGWGGEGTALVKITLAKAASWHNFISGQWPALHLLHLLVLVLSVMMLGVISRRIPKAYVLWTAAMILVSLSFWKCMGRFVTVIFPVFLGGALVVDDEKPSFQVGVLFSVMMLVLLMVSFGHFFWVT